MPYTSNPDIISNLSYTRLSDPDPRSTLPDDKGLPTLPLPTHSVANPISSTLAVPLFNEVHELVTTTNLADKDTKQQVQKIVTAFNRHVQYSALTTTLLWARGQRLKPNEFWLVHRNNVPELAAFTEDRTAIVFTLPGEKTGDLGKFDLNTPYFGAYGSHVVNVPQGKYAKIWRGNKPFLLGEGPHVIHDATLKFSGNAFNPATDLIDQNPTSQHIEHGALHIVRVQPGQVAKITINGQPYILPSREEPYAFNMQNFQFGGLENQATTHIQHGTIHIVRVQQGQFAKIMVDGQAQLLMPRAEPYVYNTPYFEWKEVVSQTEHYVGHGNKHILRVPPGRVAKVTVDGQPLLLESRSQPYEFDTLYFKLMGTQNARGELQCFEDATSRLIVNGNLKRLIPRTGEVAITYDNGKLRIVSPSEDQQPIMIASPTHEVDPDFLSVGIQTLIFPSDKTKGEKKKDNSKATEDEIAYEVFTTKDSLRVGVKLMVAYEISDPALALRRLVTNKGILDHIENCAVVDMGKAIQRCSSQEFLSFYQTKPRNGEDKSAYGAYPSAPPVEHFQDEVKNQLSTDLSEYGIKLVRLNIETPKVLDETIARQMGSQSIATAQASAKEATLDTNFAIARREAQQAAEVIRIKQEQENNNLVSAARANFEATKLNKTADVSAQAAAQETLNQIALSKAQNDLETARLRAEVTATDAKAENARLSLHGQRFHDYPELLQLELEKIRFAALAQTKPVVSMNVTSEEMRNMGQLLSTFSMFGNGLQRALPTMQSSPMQPVIYSSAETGGAPEMREEGTKTAVKPL